MNAFSGINAYTKIGRESGVLGASPHELIAMLFDGAILAIGNARSAMSNRDVPAKGAAISKAIAIIGEGLHASLDTSVGGELAQSLAALYSYMVRRLVEANLNNDDAMLAEVEGLLRELKVAWDSIRPQPNGAVAGARISAGVRQSA